MTIDLIPVARAELGVVEVGGPNRGPRVEEYLRSVHLKPGDPWCAAFVAWCGRQAVGQRWPLPMVGGCASLALAAERQGMLSSMPKVGGLGLIFFPSLKRFAHVVILIEELTEGRWRTIEGNTNPGGGREGYGVFERTRRFTPSDRFIIL